MKLVNLVKFSAAAMLLVSAAASAQQVAGTEHDLGTGAGNTTGGIKTAQNFNLPNPIISPVE
jgi:hypothetical protein